MFLPRGVEGREFSAQCRWISRIGADLNHFLSSAGKPGEKIHLQIITCFHVGDIGALPLQFTKDDQFERVAGIPAAARVEGLDQARINRVELAGICIAPPLRFRRYWHRGQQECIDEMAEQIVHGGLADRVSLRSKVVDRADWH